jgi:hypothetical protein
MRLSEQLVLARLLLAARLKARTTMPGNDKVLDRLVDEVVAAEGVDRHKKNLSLLESVKLDSKRSHHHRPHDRNQRINVLRCNDPQHRAAPRPVAATYLLIDERPISVETRRIRSACEKSRWMKSLISSRRS